MSISRKRAFKSRRYQAWRLAVFRRDGFVCQDCGKVGGYLEADHVKPWVLYPELRFSVANGRTLCKKCHEIKTEKDYKVIYKKLWA